jgi:hypothetical protein
VNAAGFARSQHEFSRADAHMQGPAETRPAQHANAVADTKTERNQALVEFLASSKRQYDCALARVEPVQRQRGCNGRHVGLL